MPLLPGLAAALGVLLLLSGCAGTGVAPEELPGARIALVYRTPQEARDRADAVAAERGESARRSGGGLMHLNDAGGYVDRLRAQMGGGAPRRADRYQGRVALLDPRTGELETLDAMLPGALPLDWSADGARLLFAGRRDGEAQLFEYDVAARVVSRVSPRREAHIQGSYGPEGRIAFVEARRRDDRQIHVSIWALEPGQRPTNLTEGPADAAPQWSRDGRWLVFQSADARHGRVIRSRDLTDPDAEARVVARGADPALTPAGDWVVYTRQTRKGWRLWRMRPDGTGKSALGIRDQGEADERSPTVSPDGRFVAYVANEEHRQKLRIRRIDGTGDRPLLHEGDGAQPAW